MVREIQICSSCARDALGLEPGGSLVSFLSEVEQELARQKPDVTWHISMTGCQRFCPPQRITLVMSGQLTMSREGSIKSVVDEALYLHAKASSGT